jgi:hypothetical protein
MQYASGQHHLHVRIAFFFQKKMIPFSRQPFIWLSKIVIKNTMEFLRFALQALIFWGEHLPMQGAEGAQRIFGEQILLNSISLS